MHRYFTNVSNTESGKDEIYMHCGHCRSHMNETHKESTPYSTQVWYKCTMCGRVSMHSLLSKTHAVPGWWDRDMDELISDEYIAPGIAAGHESL